MAPIEQPDKPKAKILIVDDEYDIRLLLGNVLKRGGDYDLYEAVNGVAAQEMLLKTDMDVVITDLIMPRMGGLRLMQWAKEHCPGPSWIILSGRGTFEDAVLAIQLGAFDFVTKPLLSLDSLLVTVRNALTQRSLTAQRKRLTSDIEHRNTLLNEQVSQLRSTCRVLSEQAETIEEDLRRAELIQRALLPRTPPRIKGVSVNAIYRPSHKVGGDLYDAVRLDDRYAAAYIADAAGHGVSAAMLAVLFKHRLTLYDERTSTPAQPSEVLGTVNRCLMEECKAPGLFVTAAYCLLDTETRQLSVASAGHLPLILHRAGGEVEIIYHTGPALGLSEQAKFAQESLEFRDEDRLLLYTDGLCDQPTTAEALTTEQIARVLGQKNLDGLEVLHALLETAAQRRQGAQPEDDITMLLLSAEALPSSLDNGTAAALQSAESFSFPAKAEVLMGTSDNSTAISIEGRGNWTFCAVFLKACLSELDARRPLTLDVSMCPHLDSTFLGTIQEVVDYADQLGVPLRIQGVLAELQNQFEELGMQRVTGHMSSEVHPLPRRMHALAASPGDGTQDRLRILLAHQALASLSQENRREFCKLIERFEDELQHSKQT